MKPIRVLIVEDSPVVQEHLRRIISADPRLEVAAIAGSGEDALAMVHRVSPDVISMDIHLPGMQGFEAARSIMIQRPTPIVIVSGIKMEEMALTMRALKAGALAVVEKPVSATHQDYDALASRLCTQLVIMSDVKVVRQRHIQHKRSDSPPPTFPSGMLPYRVLGVAASTGGPSALLQLLTGLGADFPLPLVLVQHMTPAFLAGFGEWLASVTPFPVSIINAPTPLRPGHVYLAPSTDAHLVINGMVGSLNYDAPVGGHRPSANILFSSMARSLGAGAIGIQLTGMGEDGALGIRDLKQAGSFTIAEDESSAVIYGMPRAAVRLGGICESMPLADIASRVLELTTAKSEAL